MIFNKVPLCFLNFVTILLSKKSGAYTFVVIVKIEKLIVQDEDKSIFPSKKFKWRSLLKIFVLNVGWIVPFHGAVTKTQIPIIQIFSAISTSRCGFWKSCHTKLFYDPGSLVNLLWMLRLRIRLVGMNDKLVIRKKRCKFKSLLKNSSF